MKLFEVFVTAVGIIMSLGYFPQAYKIYKSKSARNVSFINYIILSIGTLTWLVYGILLKDVVIIISFVVGVIGSWLVLLLLLKYRNS